VSGCQPVVRMAGPAQAAAYQPPEVLVHGAQIHSPNGIKAGADGNLYVASVGEQAILVMNPDTGEIVRRLGPEVGIDGPDDLAFGPDGSIYWTDFFKGSVGRLAPDGSTSSQMVATGVNPIIVAKDGRVFVALAFLGDALYELDPNLAAPPRLLAENLGGLNSFHFGSDGKLYSPVMDKGQVVRIDVDTDPITVDVVVEGLSWPLSVRFDSQDRLYTTNPPGIVRVDMETGAIEPAATVPYAIDNFVLDGEDRLFVTLYGEGTVAEAMPNGDLRMLGPMGMVMPGGVAVVPRADGESVYVADAWMLDEFDGATGELRRKVDLLAPRTVAVDGDNLLLTGWFSNAVFTWNPQTEEVVEQYYDFAMPLNAVRFGGDLIVAELGSGSVVRASGADPSQRTTLIKDLGVPAGLATNGEELWVGDRSAGNIWQLAAGGALLAEPKLVASGLDRPEGMTAADGRLLVAEAGTGRLLALDPATGETSMLAEGLGFNPDAPAGGPPSFVMNSMAVDPQGVIYATGDRADVLYRIAPVE
jgi:sugar lactone lactonase YvrE